MTDVPPSPPLPTQPAGSPGEATDVLSEVGSGWLIGSALFVFLLNMAVAWAVVFSSNAAIQQSLFASEAGGDSAVQRVLRQAPTSNANTMFLLHRVVESAVYHRLIANKQTLLVVGMALAFGLMAVGFALFIIGARGAFQFAGQGGPSAAVTLSATSPGLLCFFLATVIAVVALTRESGITLSSFNVFPENGAGAASPVASSSDASVKGAALDATALNQIREAAAKASTGTEGTKRP